MNQLEKKYLASITDGGLDADSAAFAVGRNRVVNAENVRWGSTDRGVTATVESVGGTRQISEALPSINFQTIGVANDYENNRTIYFKRCTTGPWHRITCYEKDSNTEYIVLLSSQVTGGLGFSIYYPIHSARVINGLVYWTDDTNRQRKLNIDAGIKLNHPSYVTDQEAYTSPLSQEVISLIKRPPQYATTNSKGLDNAYPNNFIGRNAFQFATRYYYRDGETSVLSVYSELENYNPNGGDNNYINVALDIDDTVDQDVQRVEMVARIANTNDFYVIKTWDKSVASEAQEIADHNAGITPLNYNFYNDRIGEFLDVAYATKPFDSVPITSKTLEIVRNRLFLANNIIGYDTPSYTTLAATPNVETLSGANTSGSVMYFQWGGSPGTLKYVIYIASGNTPGYYRVTANDGVYPSNPTDFTNLTYIGPAYADLIAYYSPSPPIVFYFINSINITNVPGGGVGQDITALKSGSAYQLGIVFYDFADRKCGVVTSDSLVYQIDPITYGATTFTTSLSWSLSQLNLQDQIPFWATTYAIVLTKCLKTRSFVQARASNITYLVKGADGNYDFTTTTGTKTTYAADRSAIGINTSLLTSYGLGYTFTEGDLCDILIGSDKYTVAVLGQEGEWVIVQLEDIGTIGDSAGAYTTSAFELYTPYQASTNEPFYEIGQKYPITNPNTDIRSFSTIAGNIIGDVSIIERNDGTNDYYTENMSPNDKFWSVWNTNTGRPNFVTRLGQSIEPNTIAYSNTYVSRGAVNGLSSFDALNERELPIECGPIQKLQVTGKVQNEQGIVMLAICQNQTASLYMGEVQLVASAQNAFLAQAPEVIGTINVLKGNFGTIDPTSVTEFKGLVFWLDRGNGKVIQYSTNGLFAISSLNMTRFWRLFCNQYNSMTTDGIIALGSYPYVVTTVDPHHIELLITIPKLLNNPPKGYLPDYPSVVYPFDIWDGRAKTLVYKFGFNDPFWMGAYMITPEAWATVQNQLYASNVGIVWECNQANYNNFFGAQYKSRVMCVSNELPSVPKVYNSLAVEADMVPTLFYMYADAPYQQATDIVDFEWRSFEGIYYSNVKRNKLQPTATGYNTNGLIIGQKMRAVAMYILAEFTVSENNPLELRFLNINFDISRGHTTEPK